MICFLLSLFTGLGFIALYMISVSPERLSRKMGEKAYDFCGRIRAIAIVLYIASYASFVLYHFFPVSGELSPPLPWNYGISLAFAALSAVYALIMVIWGMVDAGSEAIAPDKSSTLYNGIYRFIRHPQIIAELSWWFTTALFLNSYPLLIASCVWIIPFAAFAYVEDRDLLLRYGKPFEDYRKSVPAFFPKLIGIGKSK